MRTRAYIDGFNLYYGSLKGTELKWLNPLSLVHQYFDPSKYEIDLLRFFTARCKPRVNDPYIVKRQSFYLRALRTVPQIKYHLGHFMQSKKKMMKADTDPENPKFVNVIKDEEKGSDVNFASYLLVDAFRNKMDCAIIVTNDSDLYEPVRIVKAELKKKICLLNPQKTFSSRLAQLANQKKQVRKGALEVSQFPPILKDIKGSFSKPDDWL